MVATVLEGASRVLTMDCRKRPSDRLLVGARGSGLQPRVIACAEQDLVEMVRETMQPAHASLWLLPDLPAERKRRARISRQAQRLVHSLSGVLIQRGHLMGVSRASRIAEQQSLY
jgi:hypothetical protein